MLGCPPYKCGLRWGPSGWMNWHAGQSAGPSSFVTAPPTDLLGTVGLMPSTGKDDKAEGSVFPNEDVLGDLGICEDGGIPSDDPTRQKEHRGLMCHQCLKSGKVGVVICSKCKRKRYCYQCIAKW
ncbi:putative transcription factor 5qNCA [Forsythia ovata]|uniref:Transcription factor 5qNCA n=1 Tax=Forsythia ovata TaxID=205694 RepID=A0ABD1X1F0_9LAMI